MVALDEEGNEHELAVGDLVKIVANDRQHLVGRVQLIHGRHGPLVKFELSEWGDYLCHLGEVVVTYLTNEPPDDGKEPTLLQRRDNFIRNLRNAKSRCDRAETDGDYTLLDRFLYFLTHSIPPQHNWFWSYISESSEDPRHISYASDPKYVDCNARRTKTTIAKFLKRKGREYGAPFTDEEANRIGELVGNHFPNSYAHQFEEQWGDDAVYRAYNDPGTPVSCMTGKAYVHWYDENPKKVGVVRISQGGSYFGRALIWNTDQGVKVVDRVYPSDNGPHTPALHQWAESLGYDYKTRQSSCPGYFKSGRTDYTVTMAPSESGHYPYVDTFANTDNDPCNSRKIVLSCDVSGRYCLQSTSGGYDGAIQCEHCGDRVEENDAHSDDNGYQYCESCFDDMFVFVSYTRPGGRYVERTVCIDDACACDHCDEYRLASDIERVNVSNGRGETRSADWCCLCIQDDAACCDHCNEYVESDLATRANDAYYCQSCFEDIGSFCEECGEACLTEDMAARDDCLYCSDCAPEDAEYAEKEDKPAPTPQPEPVQKEQRPSINPWPDFDLKFRNEIAGTCSWEYYACEHTCDYCDRIREWRREYYLLNIGWYAASCPCESCTRIHQQCDAYVNQQEPHPVERRIIEWQQRERERQANATVPPPQPPRVDSPLIVDEASPLTSQAFDDMVEIMMASYTARAQAINDQMVMEILNVQASS